MLTGAEPLLRFFAQAAARTGFECLAVLPVGGRALVGPAQARPLFQQITGRGVDVKVLYPTAARHDPGIAAYARWIAGLGASVRTAAGAAPPTMMVFDRKLLLLPLAQQDRTLGSTCVADPVVVSALTWLFEEVWEQADPIGGDGAARPEGPDGALTDLERRLLRLLADGGTDESVARQLALSVRSERRIVAGLMARLGAVSRFEAGHKATRRDWL